MHDETHPAGSVAPDAGPRSRVKGSTSSANIDAHRGLDAFSGVTVHTGLIMRSHRVLDLLNFTVCSPPWALWTFLDKSWEAVAHSLRLQPAVCKWTQWHASQPRPLPTSSIVVICIVHRSIFVTRLICSLGASCEYEGPSTLFQHF